MKENWVEEKKNYLVVFIRLFVVTEIKTNVLLNMIKWSIVWRYLDILKVFGCKICKLLSLIMDNVSLTHLWPKHTFKDIVE